MPINVAIGAKSRSFDEITAYCKENKIPYYIIGDAVKTRRALNATAEAGAIARAI